MPRFPQVCRADLTGDLTGRLRVIYPATDYLYRLGVYGLDGPVPCLQVPFEFWISTFDRACNGVLSPGFCLL